MRSKLQALSLVLLVTSIACDAPAPIGDPTAEPKPKTVEMKMSDGVKISTTTVAVPGQEIPPPRPK